MFLARFNLFANSYVYLLRKARADRWLAFEMLGIAFFWSWFIPLLRAVPGWGTRIAFLILCFGAASPVHVQVRFSMTSFPFP
jgi:delta8-fatty-acid desaturase